MQSFAKKPVTFINRLIFRALKQITQYLVLCLSKFNSASRHDSLVDYLNCFQMNIVLQYINVSVNFLQQSNINQYLHKVEG